LAGQHPVKGLLHGGTIIGVDQVQESLSRAFPPARRDAIHREHLVAQPRYPPAGNVALPVPDVRKRLRLAEQGFTADKGRFSFNAFGNISRVDDDPTN
jgi:hypothetical protein